jgi:hypothetical protein
MGSVFYVCHSFSHGHRQWPEFLPLTGPKGRSGPLATRGAGGRVPNNGLAVAIFVSWRHQDVERGARQREEGCGWRSLGRPSHGPVISSMDILSRDVFGPSAMSQKRTWKAQH